MDEVYNRLIRNQDKRLDYNKQIIDDIDASRRFQEEYCCINPIYLSEVEKVKNSMPKKIEYGTVADYLYACFQPSISIETACVPNCERGLKNPSNKDCTFGIYEKHDGKLIKTNNNNTEDIYVFLGSGETLTPGDREFLKSQGVKFATIYSQDGNSIDYVMGDTIDLYEPIPEPIPEPAPSQTYYYWWWGLGFLILMIIIVGVSLYVNK